MPKSSQKQIEKDENKILNEIKQNANKSINEIAKKCGFSRQKVWRIINRLEKTNVIWGYVTVTDPTKQGLKNFMILLKKTNKPLNKELVDKLVNMKLTKFAKTINIDIYSSQYTNGKYDWILYFTAKDIKDAKKLAEAINKLYEGDIQEIDILEILFPLSQCGLQNPKPNNLREHFIV